MNNLAKLDRDLTQIHQRKGPADRLSPHHCLGKILEVRHRQLYFPLRQNREELNSLENLQTFSLSVKDFSFVGRILFLLNLLIEIALEFFQSGTALTVIK